MSVLGNRVSVAHKASSGITVCFPDVCKTPAGGPAFMPIPYPNIAKTASKHQQKVAGTSRASVASSKGSSVSMSENKAAVLAESALLRGTLAQLHNRLSSMSSKDPNEWQKVLQDYAVAASALFVTLHSDDDD